IMLRARMMRVHFFRAPVFLRCGFARPLRFYLVVILPHLKHCAEYEKCLWQAHNIEFSRTGLTVHLGPGLPEKTIAKNFVSLITYPHSDADHLEKRPFTKVT